MTNTHFTPETASRTATATIDNETHMAPVTGAIHISTEGYNRPLEADELPPVQQLAEAVLEYPTHTSELDSATLEKLHRDIAAHLEQASKAIVPPSFEIEIDGLTHKAATATDTTGTVRQLAQDLYSNGTEITPEVMLKFGAAYGTVRTPESKVLLELMTELLRESEDYPDETDTAVDARNLVDTQKSDDFVQSYNELLRRKHIEDENTTPMPLLRDNIATFDRLTQEGRLSEEARVRYTSVITSDAERIVTRQEYDIPNLNDSLTRAAFTLLRAVDIASNNTPHHTLPPTLLDGLQDVIQRIQPQGDVETKIVKSELRKLANVYRSPRAHNLAKLASLSLLPDMAVRLQLPLEKSEQVELPAATPPTKKSKLGRFSTHITRWRK